ncbi:MAG: penicillin acylase family protein [Vicinamibacterales bacterium]
MFQRLPSAVRCRVAPLLVVALFAAACQSAPATTTAAGPSAGTEILWDRYGVPHIFAPDHASLFQAYGYAQMEAHAELLVRLYAQARGRGAEFYGEQYLASDRWVRTNGLPDTAKQWATGQSPEFAPLIEAFARGLNQWADEHKAELSPEAQAVLPLTPVDVYAHGLRTIHYDWIVSPRRLETRLARWEDEVHGSNEWAVSASRSASGHALLMSNSHLQRGDIHLLRGAVTAPGVMSYGAVWVGFPVLRQCFTDTRGLDPDDEQPVRNPTSTASSRRTAATRSTAGCGRSRRIDEIIKVRQADGLTK